MPSIFVDAEGREKRPAERRSASAILEKKRKLHVSYDYIHIIPLCKFVLNKCDIRVLLDGLVTLRFLYILTRTSLKNKKSVEVTGMECYSQIYMVGIGILYRTYGPSPK